MVISSFGRDFLALYCSAGVNENERRLSWEFFHLKLSLWVATSRGLSTKAKPGDIEVAL